MRIQGGKILTADGPVPADVHVAGENIVAVTAPGQDPSASQEPSRTTFDATGRWVLPGAVDAHTHFGMPLAGGLRSLGWRESSTAALLGGTTTVVDFANPLPGEPLLDTVARWRTMADGRILCDYGLHATITDTDPARLREIPALVRQGVPTFKGFLAYKGRLMLTTAQMSALMTAVSHAEAMLLVHAEDGESNAAAEQLLLDTGRSAPRWHPLAHPEDSEVQAVAQAIALAQTAGCPLLIVHLSTAGALAHVRRARQERTGSSPLVLGEVCLHHLFADAGRYVAGHEAALAAICSPPLRPANHGSALLAGLATGDIELLSTDHCEFALSDKLAAAVGGFPRVPNGCGSVGERLVFSHALAVAPGRLDPFRWQEVCCRLPAAHMGLGERKGRLALGHDADVVLFDPDAEYRWEPLGASDRAGSLWAGQPVKGRVTDVWLRGQQVVADGQLCPRQPGGTFLARTLSPPAEGR